MNKKFWMKKLEPLRKHIKENPKDLAAKETLNGYYENLYLRKYLLEDK